MTLKIQTIKEANEEALRNDPLREFFSWWDKIEPEDVRNLQDAIDHASREEDIQQYLQRNPKFLIQHLGGGHGRWIIPKLKLGSEHVTDFVVGEKNSDGFTWQAVELESPLNPMFNKNGDPSRHLNHAIRQIQDWRNWLIQNQNYASRLRAESGLGLTDIRPDLMGLILIDRRENVSEETHARRRQIAESQNIRIHTYDFLVESLEGRLQGRPMSFMKPFRDET